MDKFTRLAFRGDAVLDFTFGVLAFISPWASGLFELLDLPYPQPAFFTQFSGILLIGFAYLLWIAPDQPEVARPVGLCVGVVNIVGVIAIIGWLISGQLGIGTLGTLILIIACVLLVVYAFGEIRYALRQSSSHRDGTS